MKKIISGLVAFAFLLSNTLAASAIDFVPSSTELRFSESSPTQTFTVTLSDDPEKLAGKDKTIKAKLKLNKKYFETDLKKNIIEIPVTDGAVGTSQEITVTLKDPETYEESVTVPFKIKAKKKLAKKLDLETLKDNVYVDVGNIELSGQVTTTLGSSTSSTAKARIINPLNTAGIVRVELHKVNDDGTVDEEVLLETTTDASGNFNMSLPPEAQLGTKYVIEVPDLGYIVFITKSENLEVDPVHHYVSSEIFEELADPDFNPSENFENLIESLADQIEEIGANLDGEDLDSIVAELKDLFKDFMDNLLAGMEEGSSYCTDPENDDLSDEELAARELGGENYHMAFYRSDMGTSTDDNTFFSESRVAESFEYGSLEMSRPDCFTGLIEIFPKFFGSARGELIKFDRLSEELEPFENDLPDFCQEGNEHFDQVECDQFLANKDDDEHVCHDSAGNEVECPDEEEHHDDDCTDPTTGEKVACDDHNEHVCHDPATNEEIPCDDDDKVCQDEAGNEFPCEGDDHVCQDEAGNEFPCDGGDEGPGKDDFLDDTCFFLHAFNHEHHGSKHEEHPFYASVNASNVVSLIEPTEEELDEHEVEDDFKVVGRNKDSSKLLFPVGADKDVYLSVLSGGREEFTKDGGTKLFDETEIGFVTAVKESNVDISQVSKTYGAVSISTDLGDDHHSDGRIEMQNYVGKLVLNAGTALLTGTGSQIELNRYEDSTATEEGEDDETDEKTCREATISSDSETVEQIGTIQSEGNFIKLDLSEATEEEDDDDEAALTGMSNSDASILFFLTADDRSVNGKTPEPGDDAYHKDRIDSAAREFTVAVELGSPSLVGNSYFILSYDKYITTDGKVSLANIDTTGINPQVSFNTSTLATIDSLTVKETIQCTCDTSIESTESTTLAADTSYTLGSDGAISMEIAGRSLNGYVSANADLIVLQGLDTSTNRQSMYILVKQQSAE